MTKTPDQQIYDAIFSASVELGYKTYPFNPPPGTSYPFVHLGTVQLLPRATKSHLLGTVQVVFDVWGDKSSRAKVAAMANNLLTAISKIKKTSEGLVLFMDTERTSTEIMPDNSSIDDLWRARVTLQLQII